MLQTQRVMTEPTTDIRQVAINDLHLDPEYYQREPDPNRVRKIIEAFDPNAVGVILVNERRDGRLFVMDGGHRVWALLELGIDTWLAEYHVGLTRQEEAAVFAAANNRKPLTPEQLFKAKWNGGDRVTNQIVDVITKHGFVPLGSKSKGVRATQQLYMIYNRWGIQTLDSVFGIITGAWRSGPYRTSANLIFGIALFIAVYGTSFDRDDLIRKLAMRLPLELIQEAKAFQFANGGDVRTAFAKVIVRQFNKGKRVNTLEDVFVPGRRWSSFGGYVVKGIKD